MDSTRSRASISISVFGLGYVGSVTAACLAERGSRVIGCDVAVAKVDQINAGQSPISEPGLAELIRKNQADGRLRACTGAAEAIAESQVSLICVGTPSQASGALDLRFVEAVAGEIAAALEEKPSEAGAPAHAVVFRSTMLPGSTRQIAEQYFGELLADGKVEVFFYPEFLRQGTAIDDFKNPSLAAVGVLGDGRSLGGIADALNTGADCPAVSLETAELLK